MLPSSCVRVKTRLMFAGLDSTKVWQGRLAEDWIDLEALTEISVSN